MHMFLLPIFWFKLYVLVVCIVFVIMLLYGLLFRKSQVDDLYYQIIAVASAAWPYTVYHTCKKLYKKYKDTKSQEKQ